MKGIPGELVKAQAAVGEGGTEMLRSSQVMGGSYFAGKIVSRKNGGEGRGGWVERGPGT